MNVVLTITMDDGGNIGVSGPLNNKLLCFGLLEVAKTEISKFDQKEQSRIIQPNMVVEGQLVS